MKIFFTITILLLNINLVFSQELVFGVSKIPESINLYSPNTKLENLLSEATSFGLFGYSNNLNIDKDSLIKSYSSNYNATEFIFNVKPDLFFSNNNKIYISDIIYSLNSCELLKKYNYKKDNKLTNDEELKVSFNIEGNREDKLKIISNCKIFSKNVATNFGKDFGQNTSFISKAKYSLYEFVPRKRVLLLNYNRQIKLNKSPYYIKFIKYQSPSIGLTKLRAGGIDVLLSDDQKVKEKVLKDETLSIKNCYNTEFILRKSLNFECNEYLKFEDLFYRD